GVVREKTYDPQDLNEKMLMRSWGVGKVIYRLMLNSITKGQRARNLTATLENTQTSMDEAGVDFTVCLPIAPYVTFEDLKQAADIEKRIIPFTSVDFSRKHDVGERLAKDVEGGAKGLKLHPIIQRVPLSDKRTLEAVQAFSRFKKPVLTHSGKSHYYLKNESEKQAPENGDISAVEKLVRSFPDVNFIVGHSGLFWRDQVQKKMAGCQNVWVDVSFQSPRAIKGLVKTFGAEKVMFASDWPWGGRAAHVKTVKAACRGDSRLEKMILGENAARLLDLAI
ncbi:MAG: amidohydrolase family protein, partial [Proteobacteria bacterium]|nr:amidohydrolase family protein [Pseudomonadota bacterium]